MALAQNLIAYWKFDGSGTDSWGIWPVSFTGAGITYVTGKINNAANFPGTAAGYMVLSASGLALSRPWSIQAWCNFTASPPSTYQTFVAHSGTGGPLLARIGSSGKLTFFDGADHLTTSTISTGTWHHIVFTMSSVGDLKIYVDGVQDASTFTGVGGGWNNLNAFGGDSFAGDAMYGSVDEIAIWKRELSSTEVGMLYNSGAGISLDNFILTGTKSNFNSGFN